MTQLIGRLFLVGQTGELQRFQLVALPEASPIQPQVLRDPGHLRRSSHPDSLASLPFFGGVVTLDVGCAGNAQLRAIAQARPTKMASYPSHRIPSMSLSILLPFCPPVMYI